MKPQVPAAYVPIYLQTATGNKRLANACCQSQIEYSSPIVVKECAGGADAALTFGKSVQLCA